MPGNEHQIQVRRCFAPAPQKLAPDLSTASEATSILISATTPSHPPARRLASQALAHRGPTELGICADNWGIDNSHVSASWVPGASACTRAPATWTRIT